MFCLLPIALILTLFNNVGNVRINVLTDPWEPYIEQYGYFSESLRLEMLQKAKDMFYFGYDNYMKYAFPKDELDPIHCTGRGPDYDNPSNININDVLGDYALTLVDALDTIAVIGNATEFQNAVQLVISHVSFDRNSTVQLFEANIRVLGALLSAHLIIVDPQKPFGDVAPPNYDNELLFMAHDLASRLLPAFEDTATGIPYPRVNLQQGVLDDCVNETCTAGAGTLLLEFGILGHLLNDPVYESLARKSTDQLWNYRSNVTGLFGNVIDIQTGEWKGRLSGVGAGIDSFFEYLFKSFVMFGDVSDLQKFTESYDIIKYYMRKGRKHCNTGSGYPPIYVNVDMKNGDTLNNWVDSLQAAWPGLQVLIGDLEEAICAHALHYTLWQKFDALPERYNWHLKTPEVFFYPLRPELIESTYLLYQATKNPFYLHVGTNILNSLNNHSKVQCGYATIHDVRKKDLEDRMESFFLSETCKYLYLLFDKDNHVNTHYSKYLFSTEGHLFPVHRMFRKDPWQDMKNVKSKQSSKMRTSVLFLNKASKKRGASTISGEATSETMSNISNDANEDDIPLLDEDIIVYSTASNISHSCERVPDERRYLLPIKSEYLKQLEDLIGLGTVSKAHLSCS